MRTDSNDSHKPGAPNYGERQAGRGQGRGRGGRGNYHRPGWSLGHTHPNPSPMQEGTSDTAPAPATTDGPATSISETINLVDATTPPPTPMNDVTITEDEPPRTPERPSITDTSSSSSKRPRIDSTPKKAPLPSTPPTEGTEPSAADQDMEDDVSYSSFDRRLKSTPTDLEKSILASNPPDSPLASTTPTPPEEDQPTNSDSL